MILVKADNIISLAKKLTAQQDFIQQNKLQKV